MTTEQNQENPDIKFSKEKQMAQTLASLERKLPVDTIMDQMNRPRPGNDRYPEFKPQPNDIVTVYRSDGSEDSDWAVDQTLSRPGNLTVAGLVKTDIGPNGPRRQDKVLTTDSFAKLNIEIGPEIQTDKNGDQDAIKDYLRAHGKLKD